jgi:hypothetical protein
MEQAEATFTIATPAFSMKPPEGTFTVVGTANRTLMALHTAYLEQIMFAGDLFAKLNESDNGAMFRYKQHLVTASRLYCEIMQTAALLTGYAHPFFLPETWQIAVMNGQLEERIVDDDPASW